MANDTRIGYLTTNGWRQWPPVSDFGGYNANDGYGLTIIGGFFLCNASPFPGAFCLRSE